jgi:hypothetical protein
MFYRLVYFIELLFRSDPLCTVCSIGQVMRRGETWTRPRISRIVEEKLPPARDI